MDWFDGQQVSRPLGGRTVPPIEWPEERVRRPGAGPWIGLAVFAIVSATAILIGSGIGDASTAGAAIPFTPVADAAPPQPTTRADGYRARAQASPVYAVHVDGLPSLGRDDAKVTVVVAYDYTCTACDVRDLIAGLRARHGDELRVVFKPASFDPSLPAACAAAAQGAFTAFDTAVWRLVDKGVAIDAARVTAIARELELEGPRYRADVARCTTLAANSVRELDALRAPASAMFVNGRFVGKSGEVPAVVADELARATERIAAGTLRDRYYREWVLDLGLTQR